MRLKSRVEELEGENAEISANLTKREQELDAKTQEKEDLQSNLERTKEKLEMELMRHNEARFRLGEIESQMPELAGSAIKGSTLKTTTATTSMAPPPPPPPGPPGPPPPPPPSVNGLGATKQPMMTTVKKNVPQSSNPLKSFNWSKLPDCKVQGTIWTELDEMKLYKSLNLVEVDKLFSAYQKNGLLVKEKSA